MSFLFGWLLAINMSFAANLDEIVGQVEKRYKAIKSLQANFIQTIKNPSFDQPLKQQGQLLLQRPHFYRSDIKDAVSYITNGEKIWIWNPVMNQVIISSYKNKKDQIGALLSDLSNLRKNYNIALGPESAQSYQLEVKPKKEAAFEKLILQFSKKDFLIEGLHLSGEATGDVQLQFSKVVLNGSIDAKKFQFTPAKGVEVIDGDDI